MFRTLIFFLVFLYCVEVCWPVILLYMLYLRCSVHAIFNRGSYSFLPLDNLGQGFHLVGDRGQVKLRFLSLNNI